MFDFDKTFEAFEDMAVAHLYKYPDDIRVSIYMYEIEQIRKELNLYGTVDLTTVSTDSLIRQREILRELSDFIKTLI